MTTQFCVLGAVGAFREGESLSLGGPIQRTVLAVLIAHANEVVSADGLVEEVWGESLGSDPYHTLRVHLSELRKVLEPGHQRGEAWSILETVGDGYRFRVEPGDIDALRAEVLLGKARLAFDEGRLEPAHDI
jgi:DNA-binding response OmpR family regulator